MVENIIKDPAEFVITSELFNRYEKNPLLTSAEWPYRTNAVFNAGAVRIKDETILLVRIEDMRGFSHLTIARSKDGKTDWKIDDHPTLKPQPDVYPEEVWGIEDPRIMYLEERREYAITYTAYSYGGPLVSLAMTEDFQSFNKMGSIMPPEDKDASLFPYKFKGRWALIHRPVAIYRGSSGHIWISYSPDLKHWGDHKIILKARAGGWWDADKIGLGPPPIETSEGWLIIYHGIKRTASGSIYRLGLALLDLENPEKVLHRSNEWVFGPRMIYERIGDVPSVTFPCGTVLDKSKNELLLYYGAADTTICLAIGKIDEILEYILSCPRG
ncbi:glycosidase [Candidatus Bathyarchaeota archaeon]|nr:MAG: glycosidase [Candidatus Bathyarchaeota archaeon]